jgi:AcrR family transcriptional regulator
MQRLAPSELTLAAIASEAGVTAAALSQRFGSKRALLLSLSAAAARSAGELIEELATQHGSPLAAVRAYVACMAGMASSPEMLARSLAYLQLDMMDAEFRAHLVAHGRANRMGLENLLAAAIAAGELESPHAAVPFDPARLASAIEAMISGSMMTWAMYQRGRAGTWMADHVDIVLAPYTPNRR